MLQPLSLTPLPLSNTELERERGEPVGHARPAPGPRLRPLDYSCFALCGDSGFGNLDISIGSRAK